jgi:SmpA/OmlA family protein
MRKIYSGDALYRSSVWRRPMTVKWLLAAMSVMCADGSVAAWGTDVVSRINSSGINIASEAGSLSQHKLAQLKPGITTKAQVQALLGVPWRTVQYNDLDQLEDEIWEYRGSDANGSYRIHIEFDHHDVVHIVAKIADKLAHGQGTSTDTTPAR